MHAMPRTWSWHGDRGLFVVVMPVGREHVNVDFRFEDFVYHAMFLRDSSAPLSVAVSLQLLRMACTSLRMLMSIKLAKVFKVLIISSVF